MDYVQRPIFVVGAARSGTVFMGQVLKAHPEVHCIIEKPSVFNYASWLGLNPAEGERRSGEVKSELQNLYASAWSGARSGCRSCSPICKKAGGVNRLPWSKCLENGRPPRLADKCHQLVLNVPRVLEAFPNAQFIHHVRDGRDVVASMLKKPKVLAWFSETYVNDKSEFPQPWFGIEDVDHYHEWRSWSLSKKCALRWRSWVEVGLDSSESLPADQWFDLRYEELVTNPMGIGRQLFSWLDIQWDDRGLANARDSSTGKWRERLSSEQVREIKPIVDPVLERLGYEV